MAQCLDNVLFVTAKLSFPCYQFLPCYLCSWTCNASYVSCPSRTILCASCVSVLSSAAVPPRCIPSYLFPQVPQKYLWPWCDPVSPVCLCVSSVPLCITMAPSAPQFSSIPHAQQCNIRYAPAIRIVFSSVDMSKTYPLTFIKGQTWKYTIFRTYSSWKPIHFFPVVLQGFYFPQTYLSRVSKSPILFFLHMAVQGAKINIVGRMNK